MTDSQKHKRRWRKYSCLALLVFVAMFAIVYTWYSIEMQKAAQRRVATEKLVELGGEVYYHDTIGQPPRWFSWLRKIHGDKYLGNATVVDFGCTQITDAGLSHLKDLPNLERLELWETQITDAGLTHLKGLTKLKALNLDDTQITDFGLAHLKGLTNLEDLALDNTQITDSGLVHVKGFAKLKGLCLGGTQITDAGLVHLKGLNSLAFLSLQNTQTDNVGLVHLLVRYRVLFLPCAVIDGVVNSVFFRAKTVLV